MSTTTVTQSASQARPAIKGLLWKCITLPWMIAGIWAGLVMVGPAKGFSMGGHGAKSLIFHLPCAWLTTLAYVLATVYAIRSHLRFRKGDYSGGLEMDRWGGAAMEIGFVYALLTTVTGSLFAYNEWQSFWNWDPRETSIVVLLLMMAAYLVLRGSVDQPERRARLSNAYVIITLIPAQFLIFVLPRIIFSLHPSDAVVSGQITGTYRIVIYGLILPASLFLYCWIAQLRVRIMRLEAAAIQPLL